MTQEVTNQREHVDGATPLSAKARRVEAALRALGLPSAVRELPERTHTAAEAAAAIGCEVDQIAKSIVFRGRESGRPVLVVASGGNRVDEAAVGVLLGEPIERADAAFVREATGYQIGGVPPLALARPHEVFIDRDLLRFQMIWAAAGTPHAVCELPASMLASATGGRVADVRAR